MFWIHLDNCNNFASTSVLAFLFCIKYIIMNKGGNYVTFWKNVFP
ncbi:hypothetical protein [Salmonella phage SD-6_S16]|nr:hypothetical protein [Salmonella phage SD-6_S16]